MWVYDVGRMCAYMVWVYVDGVGAYNMCGNDVCVHGVGEYDVGEYGVGGYDACVCV